MYSEVYKYLTRISNQEWLPVEWQSLMVIPKPKSLQGCNEEDDWGGKLSYWRIGSEVAGEYQWWLDRSWIKAKCPGEAIDLWEEMRVGSLRVRGYTICQFLSHCELLMTWSDMDKKMMDVNVHHVIAIKVSWNKTQTLKQLLHMSLALPFWLRAEEWMSEAGMLESSEPWAHGVH